VTGSAPVAQLQLLHSFNTSAAKNRKAVLERFRFIMPQTPSLLASTLASATWPVGGLTLMALESPTTGHDAGPPAKDKRGHAFATLSEHIGIQIASIPRLLLTYLVSEFLLGNWRSSAQTFGWNWMAPIIIRNIALVVSVCAIWDGALLWCFRAGMAKHKYNPQYPAMFSRQQTAPIARDIAWSCVTACVASAYEIVLRHLWASGRLSYATIPGALPGTDGAWWTHWPTLLWMMTWFYWQNIQFYAMHRAMHKWGTTSIPDVGAWLYKHVHRCGFMADLAFDVGACSCDRLHAMYNTHAQMTLTHRDTHTHTHTHTHLRACFCCFLSLPVFYTAFTMNLATRPRSLVLQCTLSSLRCSYLLRLYHLRSMRTRLCFFTSSSTS
jgi:hypothetical protein